MRLTLNIESRRHPQREVEASTAPAAIPAATPPLHRDEAYRVIEDAWRKAAESFPPKRTERMQWVGGAITAYATLLGLDAEAVRAELLERIPLASRQQPDLPEFAPGFTVEPPDPNVKPTQWRVDPEPIDNGESIVDAEATS